MATSTNTPPSATQGTADTGLLATLANLLGSAKNSLDNGIKTQVTVVFPSTVYFDIFALVVFCALAVVGINMAARALKLK